MKNKFIHHLLAPTLLVATASQSWGQGVTTSAMSGIVTDKTGEGLPGATVIATHTPTGTQYVAPTNAEGRYNLQNMRVGGPYTVRITFIGYQEITRENIFLTLGQNLRLDVNLSETTTQLADVVVTGEDSRSVLNAGRSGAVTYVGTEEIQRLPSITRSLNDFTRLTPQSNNTGSGPAIGGGNYRQNNITIDGSDFNNTFGIGQNLPANGNPISLDAIQEVTVNVTPYDVRQSNFVGSAINAVTRSGSNDFSGSIYTFWRNDRLQGNKVGTEEFTKQRLDETQYGFRFGGPILKNKLFFFVNAERRNTIAPGPQNVASSPSRPYGSASNVARPTEQFLNEVQQFLRDSLGYDPGSYQGYSFKSERTNLLGRIDWNISSNHHLTVRYSQVESRAPIGPSTSTTGLAQPYIQNRTSIFALPFRNAGYFQDANFYSLAIEENSTFGRFFNTFRGTFTQQNDPRSSDSELFPFVDILGPDGNPLTSFGYELFSYGNLRDVKSYSVVDFANVSTGIHNLTFGLQGDLQTTRNGFQRFGSSYYAFDSWTAFKRAASPDPKIAASAAPFQFATTYSLLPGYEQAFPRFKFAQASLYAQDEINVNERLRVTAGLRAELNAYLDVQEIKTLEPLAAVNFGPTDDGEQRRVDTGQLPKNKVMWSPRLGFNWDALGDRTLQVRGGSGLFAGRVPTVWVVAQSGDAGLIQATYATLGAPNLPGVPYQGFKSDIGFYRPNPQPTAGTQILNQSPSATDPNFRNPQTWKSSLAVDAKLPAGFVFSLEGVYNRDLVTALGKNVNLVDPQALNVRDTNGDIIYPDTRTIFPNSFTDRYYWKLNTTPGQPTTGQLTRGSGNFFQPIVLSNGYKGYYWSATAKLDKRFNNGLFASAAYTASRAKNLYDGSGDQLLNTWTLNPIVNNPNNPELSYANYVIPSRVIASLSYRREYFGHLATQISVFYEGSGQGRFSYVYGGDFNRDNVTNNDLIYVPKDPSEITFVSASYGSGATATTYTPQQQSDLFFRYIEQDEYLRTRKGKYAERNGAKYPWRNQFDVRIAQDLFVNANDKRNTLQFTFDVFNFGNLLNSEWGIFRSINNTQLLVPTNTANLRPDGSVKPTFRLAADRNQPITSTFRPAVSLTSTYYAQFGLRYTFN